MYIVVEGARPHEINTKDWISHGYIGLFCHSESVSWVRTEKPCNVKINSILNAWIHVENKKLTPSKYITFNYCN